MTNECAEYLNATAGRWDKDKSDAAIAKIKEHEYLERMNAKTYVFTVTDCENSEKPTIYCQMITDKAVNDQNTAENLIMNYVDNHLDGIIELSDKEIEEYAYAMRKNGAVWVNEQYCFELTNAVG